MTTRPTTTPDASLRYHGITTGMADGGGVRLMVTTTAGRIRYVPLERRDLTRMNPTEGTYRVRFRITETGHYRFMESSKIVKATSRAAAIAATPGGQGAEVIEWGPEDPEPKSWQS